MAAPSFLVEFCCGCCMQNGNDDEQHSTSRGSSNHHRGTSRHEQHSSYYKYFSQSEREASGGQPHHNRRTHPPSSHRISERQSLHRIDSRRNGERNANLSSRRRDDASVMGASLSETYRGTLEDDGEYLDEQSAIRRSLKDARKSTKKLKGDRSQKQLKVKSEPEIASSELKKSKLETHLEEKRRPPSRSRKSRGEEDFDNVTTISKASINPYRVLGLSQTATPREVYDSYKRRRKETHPDAIGGSEKAFHDVSNAYRRLRADLKRQEARKEQKQNADKNGSDHRDLKQSAKKKSGKSRRRGKSKHKETNSDSDEDDIIVKRRQNIDGRLKDHRSLVHNLFANDNKEPSLRMSSSSVSSVGQVTTLQKAINSQCRALMAMNLVPIEAGAVNINEKNETIQNNCFYLSLAASYLSGAGAFETDPTAVYHLSSMKGSGKKSNIPSDGSVTSTRTLDMAIASLPSAEKTLTMSLALQLKRAIEAAVVLVHPNWASDGVVGEEVQAFSDFLVYALDSDSILGHWAIAVFDEASGFVDIYRGRHYGKVYPPKKVRSARGGVTWKYKDCDEYTKSAKTLTLRYIPGHYQPLLPELTKTKGQNYSRPTLENILTTLEKWKVLHVVTDGRA